MLCHFNFASQIKNAQKAQKRHCVLAYSKTTQRVVQILQNNGYIHHWHVTFSKKDVPFISIFFKRSTFDGGKFEPNNAFSIKVLSSKKKPYYVKAKALWKLSKGLELYIISTSRGLVTDREARQFNLGGKLLFLVKLLINF